MKAGLSSTISYLSPRHFTTYSLDSQSPTRYNTMVTHGKIAYQMWFGQLGKNKEGNTDEECSSYRCIPLNGLIRRQKALHSFRELRNRFTAPVLTIGEFGHA